MSHFLKLFSLISAGQFLVLDQSSKSGIAVNCITSIMSQAATEEPIWKASSSDYETASLKASVGFSYCSRYESDSISFRTVPA